MNKYTIIEHGDYVRVLWVYDETYQTRGNYAYDTEEKTKAAEDAEIASLESGELVALGAVVQHKCDHCEGWMDKDSLCGIVIEPDDEKLRAFAQDVLDLRIN